MKTKNSFELGLNLLILIIFIWFAYVAFHALFAVENEGRITFNRLALNTPDLSGLLLLLSAVLGFFLSLASFVIKIRKNDLHPRKLWILQVCCLVACSLAAFVLAYDFFTTALQGAG